MATAPPMAVVPPPIGTGKPRKRGAASRSTIDANPSKEDGGVTSPRRNSRKAREAHASLQSLEASQTVHQTETLQPDGNALSSLQARIGERATASQTNLAHQQQHQQQSPWTMRALALYKNINGRLALTPRRPSVPASRRLSDDSTPTSLRTFIRHPLLPWFLSLAIAAGLAGLYASAVGRRTPARIADQILADNFADVRQQVKDVDSRWEKVLKHMQAQVDAVDKSMKEQEKWVKGELESVSAGIDKQTKAFASKMEELEGQVRGLLGAAPPLSNVEIRALVTKVVDARAASGKGQAISLDDVRAAARSIVMDELSRHVADGGASGPDYALRNGGGQVVAHQNTKWQLSGPGAVVAGMKALVGQTLHPMAQVILEPKRGVPGECLPLQGSNGSVDVQLRGFIWPRAVALEHVPKTVAFEVTSAPRTFAIYGWSTMDGGKGPPRLLGEFAYDIEGSSVQEFQLLQNDPSTSTTPMNMIRLHVTSNHGHTAHTCIYRLRVYGSPVDVKSAPQQSGTGVGSEALAL